MPLPAPPLPPSLFLSVLPSPLLEAEDGLGRCVLMKLSILEGRGPGRELRLARSPDESPHLWCLFSVSRGTPVFCVNPPNSRNDLIICRCNRFRDGRREATGPTSHSVKTAVPRFRLCMSESHSHFLSLSPFLSSPSFSSSHCIHLR